MTSVRNVYYRYSTIIFCIGLVCSVVSLTPHPSHSGPFSSRGRSYGPTTPGGYAVRVLPYGRTMAHSQRRVIEVSVETPDGKPANGVAVRFRPSEGTVTQDRNETHEGLAAGEFAVSPGSDQPRTAFIVVSVEDVEITVFIDIVPAVFGR